MKTPFIKWLSETPWAFLIICGCAFLGVQTYLVLHAYLLIAGQWIPAATSIVFTALMSYILFKVFKL